MAVSASEALMRCPYPFVHRNLILPCGKCYACRRAKALEWSVRLSLERQYWHDACFVTLTYDDEHLGSPSLNYEDARNFLKYVRHNSSRPIKYLISGEYGDHTARKHWHAVIFGLGYNDCVWLGGKPTIPLITAAWQDKGNIVIGSAESGAISYVAGYCLKKYGSVTRYKLHEMDEMGIMPPRRYFSRGLGASWIDDHRDEILKDKITRLNLMLGSTPVSVPMPRYYVERLVGKVRKARDCEETLHEAGIPDEWDNMPDKAYLASHPLELEYLEALEAERADYQRDFTRSLKERYGDRWYNHLMSSAQATNYIKQLEANNYDNATL